jgi:hypothetical protein
MTEKHTGVGFFKKTLGIWPTMGKAIRHPAQYRAIARADESGDAAHQPAEVFPPRFRVSRTR